MKNDNKTLRVIREMAVLSSDYPDLAKFLSVVPKITWSSIVLDFANERVRQVNRLISQGLSFDEAMQERGFLIRGESDQDGEPASEYEQEVLAKRDLGPPVLRERIPEGDRSNSQSSDDLEMELRKIAATFLDEDGPDLKVVDRYVGHPRQNATDLPPGNQLPNVSRGHSSPKPQDYEGAPSAAGGHGVASRFASPFSSQPIEQSGEATPNAASNEASNAASNAGSYGPPSEVNMAPRSGNNFPQENDAGFAPQSGEPGRSIPIDGGASEANASGGDAAGVENKVFVAAGPIKGRRAINLDSLF